MSFSGVGTNRWTVRTRPLIGAGISRDVIREVGIRPLVQGVMLWVLVGTFSLIAIAKGWIHL